MSKYFKLVNLIFLVSNFLGQDRMILLNEKILDVKVIEINLHDVVYLQKDDIHIDTFLVKQKLVKQIIYKNGLIDNFASKKNKFLSFVPKDFEQTDSIMNYLGMFDAENHFRKYKKKILPLALLNHLTTPLVGYLYFKKCKYSLITEKDMITDEKALFLNETYRNSYFKQAKKMYDKKLKKAYVITSLTFLVIPGEILYIIFATK